MAIHIILDPRQNLHFAAWAILLAMVFDFLDGMAARMLQVHSELGKQLDSLCDMVSFGVAPAFLLFQLAAPVHADYSHWIWTDSTLVQWLAFGVALTSALRLAKFNIDPSQKNSFHGLPTPANALIIASIPLSAVSSNSIWIVELIRNPWFLISLMVACTWLPISRIRFMSFKFTQFNWAGNQFRFILLGVSAILFALLGFSGVLPIIFLYILLSQFDSTIKEKAL